MEIKFLFFRNLRVKVKKDIAEFIKEVKRLMVICQIKVLWGIKLKDYRLF